MSPLVPSCRVCLFLLLVHTSLGEEQVKDPEVSDIIQYVETAKLPDDEVLGSPV